MSFDLQKIEENLYKVVKSGKTIRLISYAMSPYVEKVMDKTLNIILDEFKKPDLKTIVYTCTKELVINGTKANIKRIFFEERGLDINNEKDYARGVGLYKDIMKEKITLEYGRKAKLRGLFVKISFVYNKDVLKVEVLNNTQINEQEEKRLREKFALIMQYTDLMQYYLDHADDTEGAGMGLALIMTLLLAEGIDPGFFRVGISKNETIARIEFPLTPEYVGERFKDHIIRIPIETHSI
jgi:hypothetical protein